MRSKQVKELPGAHGIFNMSATDHLGLDQRARVMVKIENGAWKYQPWTESATSSRDHAAAPCRASSPAAGSAPTPAHRCPARSTARRSRHTHAERDRLRRGAAACAQASACRRCWRSTSSSAPQRLKALAKLPDRAQGRALRDLGPHRRDARRQLDRHRRRHRHAVRLCRHRRQRAAVGQPACTKGRRCRSARRAASPARTSWCRAAASRCTSTPSTSRSGACSRSSRRASSPACRASASRPPRPAT